MLLFGKVLPDWSFILFPLSQTQTSFVWYRFCSENRNELTIFEEVTSDIFENMSHNRRNG